MRGREWGPEGILELSYEGFLYSRKVGYLKRRESRWEGIEYVAIEVS
jgi:hypothetical protein